MAEADDRKVFLWPQWERCFLLLDPILKPFAKFSVIRSNQAYEIPLSAQKGDAPGMRRMNLKRVPLGKLRWSYQDNKKWSEMPLKKGDYPIRFLDTHILSSKTQTDPPDVQIFICNQDSAPGGAFNQVLTVSVLEKLVRARPADYWESLVDDLATIVRAVRVGRTVRPGWLERPNGNVREGSSVAGNRFAKHRDSLDLEDSWQSWEYLK
jgi:hypothetical protein